MLVHPTQAATLVASGGAQFTRFGESAGVSGNIGLIGARTDDSLGRGSAYAFRNVDTTTGAITESVKLVASDGLPNDHFSVAIQPRGVSLSGNAALIGASGDDVGTNSNQGSAYFFTGLDSATGTIFESVKLTASGGTANDAFGEPVALDGDRFVIGSPRGNAQTDAIGRAYSGSVSSVTRLDAGNAIRSIGGLSFISRGDWIVGEATDGNLVSLGQGDTANVIEAGQAVFIGKNAGSNGNTLRIDGILKATEVYIGSITGNADNTLQLENTAEFSATAFRLAPDKLLKLEGNYTAFDNLRTYLGSTALQVWDGNFWQSVDDANYGNLITSSFRSGYTDIFPVPEPTAGVLLGSWFGAAAIKRRRRGTHLIRAVEATCPLI